MAPHFERERLDLSFGLFRIGFADIVKRDLVALVSGPMRFATLSAKASAFSGGSRRSM